MSKKVLIFLIIFAAFTIRASAAEVDFASELSKLDDSGFIGALSPSDVVLAERIATDLSSELGEHKASCDKSEPGTGVIIGNMEKSAELPLEVLLAKVDPTLRPLVQLAGHGKRRTAAIMLALSKIGPRANSTLPLLERLRDQGQPWATTAIESISCQKYSAVALDEFSKSLKIDYGMDFNNCLPEYLPKIFELGLNQEMIWPEGTIEGTFIDSSTNCVSVHSAPKLSTSTLKKIQDLLDNPAIPSNRKTEILRIIEEVWPKSANAISGSLMAQSKSPDENLQFVAERLLVSLGTEESAAIFNSWLGQNYSTWIWPDYVEYMHGQKATIVPNLVKQLDSPWWDQRMAAANAITELGAESSANELINAIRPDDWALTEAIVNALGSIASNNAQAKDALSNISKNYWSPKIQLRARELLIPRSKTVESKIDDQIKEIEHVGFSHVDHGLQTCKISETKLWGFPDGTKRKLDWKIANREQLPRGEFKDVSSWCGRIGDFTVLEQKEGWLAGCMGYEMDGGLAWLPKIKSKPIEIIDRLTVTSIFEFKGEVYLSGYNFFRGAGSDAGQLFRLKNDGGKWKLEPAMLLPALTDAVAITEEYMIFDDAHSTVAVDGAYNIYPLTCEQ